MKAKDLRIGNLYNMSEVGNNDVNKITGRDIYALELDPIDDIYYPIPLTEEWLLKFGFKKLWDISEGFQFELDLDNYWTKIVFQDDLSFGLEDKGGNDSIAFKNDTLGYVHKLQNLYFALTGEELEYEV